MHAAPRLIRRQGVSRSPALVQQKAFYGNNVLVNAYTLDAPATKTGADTPSAWTSMPFGIDASLGTTIDPAYRIPVGSETAQRAWSIGTAQSWNGLSAKLS